MFLNHEPRANPVAVVKAPNFDTVRTPFVVTFPAPVTLTPRLYFVSIGLAANETAKLNVWVTAQPEQLGTKGISANATCAESFVQRSTGLVAESSNTLYFTLMHPLSPIAPAETFTCYGMSMMWRPPFQNMFSD